ncbi:hypothetical protein CRENBAI_002284 [Crenichthys baileyi]|uniref:Uncharacterized protein n=1 Tax=Crenichthys baileyi TaxID=28760 RepID=A0AAV9RGU9_9TELE
MSPLRFISEQNGGMVTSSAEIKLYNISETKTAQTKILTAQTFLSICRNFSKWVGCQLHAAVASPSQGNTQTTMHTPKGNLESPTDLKGMSLDCGRKPEYPVRTHGFKGRTCKLHAERPLAGNRTQDLLAARQQCYQLRHCAALLYKTMLGNG